MQEFLSGLAAKHGSGNYLNRPTEWEVYSSDANEQGVCNSCSAFAVGAAMETCMVRATSLDGFSALPPRGLSQQNLLDCAFSRNGLAGCDGGWAFRYLEWLQSGNLEIARDWLYVDGATKFEVPENRSMREEFTRRREDGRCSYPKQFSTVLQQAIHSWDSHTEEDIENILLDGHAVVTTMEIVPDFQHYASGVFFSPRCQQWRVGVGGWGNIVTINGSDGPALGPSIMHWSLLAMVLIITPASSTGRSRTRGVKTGEKGASRGF